VEKAALSGFISGAQKPFRLLWKDMNFRVSFMQSALSLIHAKSFLFLKIKEQAGRKMVAQE